MNHQQAFYHYADPRNPYAQLVHVHPGPFFHPGYLIPHQHQYYYNQQPWQQNPNTWIPQGHPQVHPPPPSAPVTAVNEPEPESPSLKIDKFWAGRLAPVAGQAESRRLVSSVPVSLKHPDQKNATATNTNSVPPNIRPAGKLLPPRSRDSQSATSGSQGSPIPKLHGIGIEGSDVDKEDSIHNPNGFEFDIYADVYVPQYLRDIQKQPQRLKILPILPPVPPPSYLKSFVRPSMLSQPHTSQSNLLAFPPQSMTTPPPPLTMETYEAHWTALLSWELDKLASEKEHVVLWKMGIKANNWNTAEFVVSVSGIIRENYPRLEVGDLMQLREIDVQHQRGTGDAFEARVVALRKREGIIHLQCPPLKTHIQVTIGAVADEAWVRFDREHNDTPRPFTADDDLALFFNITFLTNPRPSLNMQIAVNAVAEASSTVTLQNLPTLVSSNDTLARRWLFPETEDLAGHVVQLGQGIPEDRWVDKGLNSEQRLAVRSIATNRFPIPCLIRGPPGTGKTRTIVEIVLQILEAQPEACILLCAPSNPATDTLVLRLRSSLGPHEMLRLNDPNRTFAEVPAKMTQYCYVEHDKYALPPWDTLMKYKVIVCSCLDANILVTARCTNAYLGKVEYDLVHSLHPHQTHRLINPHWTHLLIDEAAQGSEPELMIPISVVVTPQTVGGAPENSTASFSWSFEPQLVLCGDPNQLGPVVTSNTARAAELDVSFLERLFDRWVYVEHAFNDRSSMSATPFTHLVKNYRSHPVILMPPSAMFYDDSLEPCAQNGRISWSGLPNSSLPLAFFGTDSKDESADERNSWYNTGEIERIVQTITSLLSEKDASSPPLQPSQIGVMAPWRGQVWKIRERLRKEKLSGVDVGTVEDYQGRENRVIIISCVRSSARFLKEDAEKGLGFVSERKRMNVAITRAKELLVVIGNGALLRRDTYWKGFIQFAIRNQLYVGPDLGLDLDGNWVSRLESQYFNATHTNVDASEEEQGTMMVAGGIAREVLRE